MSKKWRQEASCMMCGSTEVWYNAQIQCNTDKTRLAGTSWCDHCESECELVIIEVPKEREDE